MFDSFNTSAVALRKDLLDVVSPQGSGGESISQTKFGYQNGPSHFCMKKNGLYNDKNILTDLVDLII